jgi:phosphoribosylformimino-5-aminoimidazole carboxamide ribotide isomerase
MNIIPAIDLRDGLCVRLLKGDFNRQTSYSKNPVTLAAEYEAMGATELHIVDLDGAQLGSQRNQETIRTVVDNTTLAIQLGGGIRSVSEIESWLDIGVRRLVIGSLAVKDPELVIEWLQRFGPEKIVLALDVVIDKDGTPYVATHGWTRSTDTSLWECLDKYQPAGLTHVLCTDIDRDGAMSGPNVTFYSKIIKGYPNIRLQASGGVRDMRDILALETIGASAAICGRALLDGCITAEEVSTFLRAA